MVSNRRNMVMATFLILVTTYIAMLFIGIDGLFLDYSDSAIWSVPKNLTIQILSDRDEEKFFDQEFIDRLNADERIESMQVRYRMNNGRMVKYKDKQYGEYSFRDAVDGRYTLFNTAYEKYILNLDNSVKSIVAGTSFEDSGGCQVILCDEICWALDEKYMSDSKKMQDFIGKYIYITDAQGAEIPIKIVGVYSYLFSEPVKNSIDFGYPINTNLMGQLTFIDTENDSDGTELTVRVPWEGILLNEVAYQAVEGVDVNISYADSIEIVLKDYNNISHFCEELENNTEFLIVSGLTDLEYQIGFIKKVRVLLLALMIFVSAVAVIIIIDSINIILNKKRKNMAMLNAIGIEHRTVSLMFRIEFSCVGSLSYMLSYFLSYYSLKLLVELLNHKFIGQDAFSAVRVSLGGSGFLILYLAMIILINLVILLPLHFELDKNILERIKG